MSLPFVQTIVLMIALTLKWGIPATVLMWHWVNAIAVENLNNRTLLEETLNYY